MQVVFEFSENLYRQLAWLDFVAKLAMPFRVPDCFLI
jgi:hypothetical protein